MSTSHSPPLPAAPTYHLVGFLKPNILRPFFEQGIKFEPERFATLEEPPVIPDDNDNELRAKKWNFDNQSNHLYEALFRETPHELGGTGPDDVRKQLVVVIGTRRGESERLRDITKEERARLAKFVHCYNSVIADEETRKAVGLNVKAIPLGVYPEGAIRVPTFNDYMIAELLKEPRLRKRYCLDMRKLLGIYVTSGLLKKLEENPDQAVVPINADSDSE
ncbi:hypothetical protein TRAPUB_4451 [Trametes pubescens]|uniref:Uncharacterized protein n=1 Tax=Trametes pubescens TaxID=154538 RepID=A0A1M2VBA8_TRAPU|nr:hypothetical protein TRAPUB_4451 [Trametes pubescens]